MNERLQHSIKGTHYEGMSWWRLFLNVFCNFIATEFLNF